MSLHDSIVAMTPISGTLRAEGRRPTTREVQAFLADQKEADELLMVLDEELKMMASLCPEGAAVIGPRIRRMSNVVHTEFEISGRTSANIGRVLRSTLLAPTVVGSPWRALLASSTNGSPRRAATTAAWWLWSNPTAAADNLSIQPSSSEPPRYRDTAT